MTFRNSVTNLFMLMTIGTGKGIYIYIIQLCTDFPHHAISIIATKPTWSASHFLFMEWRGGTLLWLNKTNFNYFSLFWSFECTIVIWLTPEWIWMVKKQMRFEQSLWIHSSFYVKTFSYVSGIKSWAAILMLITIWTATW